MKAEARYVRRCAGVVLVSVALGFIASARQLNVAVRAARDGRSGTRQSEPLSRTVPEGQSARATAVQRLGRVPLHFEPTAGQDAGDARFVSRGKGYRLWLTPTEAVVQLTGTEVEAAEPAVLRTVLVGANPEARITGVQELPGRINYYKGKDPAKWLTGVRTYEKVHYEGVYRGIDLVYYGNQRQLEYDFEVAPGASPQTIQLAFDGADRIRIDARGDLVIDVAGRQVRQLKPVAFQRTAGGRREVASRYRLTSENQVGFEVGPYDDRQALIIDPVLSYSSYLGGTATETAVDIAVDAAGNIYLTGHINNAFGDFPTTAGALQSVRPFPNSQDAFVTKFTPSGTALVYSTILGGGRQENTLTSKFPGDIFADAAGNAYVTGDTNSLDFPVSADAADATYGGGFGDPQDAFYTKLGPSGALVYSTYIGGTDADIGSGIAADASANVYVTGVTRSSAAEGFPLTPATAFDVLLGGTDDAFVTKFSASGAIVYSTYLGGASNENFRVGGAIAADDTGGAYVTGQTLSNDFPTPVTSGAFDRTYNGGTDGDVFFSKINTTLAGAASLVYSTYLGGTSSDYAHGIDIDAAGNAYLAGQTSSTTFPTSAGAFDPTFNVGGFGNDAFVAKINAAATDAASLVYSTFLGGNDLDEAYDIAVDPLGQVHVVGETRSADFPLVGPFDSVFFQTEPFVAKLNATGSAVLFSSYFGTTNANEGLRGVATNAAGDTYIAGYSGASPNPPTAGGHPVVNAFQSTLGGGLWDATLARFVNSADLQMTKAGAPNPVNPGQNITYTLTVTNNGPEEATGVTVSDTLPAQTTFVSCGATAGGVCGGSGNSRTVTFPPMALGASATITLVAQVNATFGATLTNTATVSSGSLDPSQLNNTATATTATCSFTITPPGIAVGSAAGTGTVAVTAAAAGCAWTAVSNTPAFLTVTGGASGTGNGPVTYSYTANTGAAPRVGTITIGGQTFTLTQGGVPPPAGSIQLSAATLTVDEAVGNAVLTVTRTGGSAGTVAVDYATSNGTATAVADYGPVSGTLTFAAGETSKTLAVVILDDTVDEPNETFTLTLANVTGGATLGSPTTETVTITDNDDPIPNPSGPFYLAEGATGPFFDLDFAIANPNAVAAPIKASFLKEDGTTVTREMTLLPTSRTTIRVNEILGLENAALSTVVESRAGLTLLVERTMFWNRQNYYGAHTERAGEGARRQWFFAEGSQGFFDTYILLANPQATTNTATVTFLTEGRGTVVRTFPLPPTSRMNVYAGSIPELVGQSFGFTVTFAEPGAAERSMYFGATRLYDGGHASVGIAAPATSWYHAEGATGSYFDTFILVANPNAAAATVTYTFFLDTGVVITKTKSIPGNSRLTVNVEAEDPRLADAAVSTQVSSDLPVVSERAMYWPGAFATWHEAHNSFGLTAIGPKWGIAEGRVGTSNAFETYILLANPNATAATVTITYLRTTGATIVKTYTVPPTSRFNVYVNGSVQEMANEQFGAVIESTQPIAVERAMYSNALGAIWAAGTNATATRLP